LSRQPKASAFDWPCVIDHPPITLAFGLQFNNIGPSRLHPCLWLVIAARELSGKVADDACARLSCRDECKILDDALAR
jgi:hypothetical protein